MYARLKMLADHYNHFVSPFLHYEYQMDFMILMRCCREQTGSVDTILDFSSKISHLKFIHLHPRMLLQNHDTDEEAHLCLGGDA